MTDTGDQPLTANERLKAGSANRTRVGILLAVAAHFGLFVLARPFQAAELTIAVNEITAIALPPEVHIPPPPGQIARPATPRVARVAVSEEITIAPTTFETNPVNHLPPPAPKESPKEDRPSFIPYDTPPVLLNAAHVRTLLGLYYPPTLKNAGIGGKVVLWLYVDEAGNVNRHLVKTSSGNDLLDHAAGRIVNEMQFAPARNRDKITPVWVQQLVTFIVDPGVGGRP